MVTIRWVSLLLQGLCCCLLASVVQAGIPVWTFTPLGPTTLTLPINGSATVQYKVTNQSRKTHTLELTPVTGINQNTGSGNCPNPFVLGYQQSCILTLDITASVLQKQVFSGPVVCQQGSTLECYQPGLADSLNITVLPLTTLSLPPRVVIPVGNPSGISVTVTNTGVNPAFNVHANLPLSFTAVTQNSSNCAVLPGNGGTCNLLFTSSLPYIAQGGIQITGTNIASPAITAIAFSINGYLVFSVSSPTSPGTAKIIDTADNSPAIPWDSGVACGLGGCTLVGAGAQSFTNGPANSSAIVAELTTNPAGPLLGLTTYAAGLCFNISNDNTGPVAQGTWFLPAICEMGPAGNGAGCSAGIANIFDNLAQFGFGGFAAILYWSSTEFNSNAAWFQGLVDGFQNINGKDVLSGVRCVRTINY